MERLTGIARAAALGRPAAEMLDFLRDVDVASHLTRALGGETATTGDVRYEFLSETRSGWIAARYVPWRDDAGAIRGVLGFHTVVTERHRRAILKGTAVSTADILHDPDTWLVPERRAQVEREGFRAVAAAPLRSKGRVHGALVVHHWAVRTLSEEDVAALQLLAEHAALAIDNARIYADATRRAERLRELTDLEQLVTESLVVDDVLRRIAQAAARLLDAPMVQLWTADPAERVVRLSASTVEPGLPEVRMPRTGPLGEGVVGRVAETKTTIYVADVAGDPRALSSDWARETGIVRMMSVPILAGNDDLLGVLVVRSRDESLSKDENRALVTSFAARAAIAMQHARMDGEAVHRAARLRDLVAVSQSITGSLDAADVMRRITQAVAGMRPGALGAVHLYDPVRGVLRAQALSGSGWDGPPIE